ERFSGRLGRGRAWRPGCLGSGRRLEDARRCELLLDGLEQIAMGRDVRLRVQGVQLERVELLRRRSRDLHLEVDEIGQVVRELELRLLEDVSKEEERERIDL